MKNGKCRTRTPKAWFSPATQAQSQAQTQPIGMTQERTKFDANLKQKKSHSKLPPFRKSVQTIDNLDPEFSLATCGKYPCQLVLCLSGISFSIVNAAQTQR